MRDDTTRQCVLFPELFGKRLAVRFDRRQGSSDGGAILLATADRRPSLSERLALAEGVIERHPQRLGRRKVRHVRIDLDPTDDPTHGAQQRTFFNGHYDCWCYLPMVGFLTSMASPISTCSVTSPRTTLASS